MRGSMRGSMGPSEQQVDVGMQGATGVIKWLHGYPGCQSKPASNWEPYVA